MASYVLLIIQIILVIICISIILKNKRLERFFSYSIAIHVIMWYIVPIIISVSSWTIYEKYIFSFSRKDISLSQYLYYANLDLLFIQIVLWVFLIIVKLVRLKPIRLFGTNDLENIRFRNFFILYTGVLLLIFFLKPISSYSERNSATSLDVAGGILDFFLDFGISFIILIILKKGPNLSKYTYLFVNIIYLSYALKVFIAGSRMAILGPLIIYTYYALYIIPKQYRTRFLALLTCAFIFTAILMPVVSKTRTQGTMSINSLNNQLSTTDNVIGQFMVELGLKLNNTFYGVYLCEFGGWNDAGFNPYKNSLYSFMPSVIYPNKPVPISKNGDLLSTPIRYAGNLIFTSDVYNVGVNPSQIALWHGGLLSYFLNMIFVILYLILIHKLFIKGHFFSQIMAILLLSYPYLDFIITFDYFLRDFPRYILMFIFFRFISSFVNLSKKSKNQVYSY